MSIILDKVNYVYSAGTAYEVQALKDINLKIKDGEFIGIIGHTGSGKSTLIQHLNGLMKAASGGIYYNGEDIYDPDYDLRQLRSKVGLVFQYPEHQLFETTIFDDVCFGPINQGLSKNEAGLRAFKALKNVGMPEELYYQSPFDLSGGQKRRAAIAGVLAMKPEVLILDEPTAGLDIIARDELLDMLRTYMEKEGRAILVSSHISSDLEGLCDDIYMIDDGKIILYEETDVLLDCYGILKATPEQFGRIEREHILRYKKEGFGYSCLTDQRQFYQENYPDIAVEKGNIDELIMMMIRGEK